MKIWKTTLISAFAFFGISSTVLYTSCEQDACLDLKCKNGGSCAEGFCRCKTGYEGAECEIIAADKFLGRYIGQRACTGSPISDTIEIFLDQYPDKVKMVQHSRPADTLSGTVKGYETDGYAISFAEYSRDNYRRYTTAKLLLDQRKLSVYNEITEDITISTNKEVCNFLGFR